MMDKDGQLSPPLEPGPALHPGLAGFAHQWTTAVITTSNVPWSRVEVYRILLGFTELLADALLDDPFDACRIQEIGKGLVDLELTGKHALDATIKVIGANLPKTLGAESDVTISRKLTEMLGALSAGYVDALRDNIFARQESIKKAVFRARDAAERALRASERRFRTVFSESVVGIAIGDLEGHIVATNAALQKMLGYDAEELRQRTAFDLMSRKDAESLTESYRRLLNGSYTSVRSEHRLIGSDGEPIWVHLAVTLIRDEQGNPEYPVAMIADISDLHLLQEKWRQQTLYDPLTGLSNRALFLSMAETISGTLAAKTKLTLCCFGIDGLAVINGAFGNHVGDRVIKIVSERLRLIVTEEVGTLSRIDGDSFAVLIPEWPPQEVIDFVDRALSAITEPMTVFSTDLSITASVGIATRNAEDADPSNLLRDAERAFMQAKEAGGAQWVWFDVEQGAREQAEFRRAASLPHALRTGQFTLEFQPMAALADYALAGVEAIPLWEHPDQGILTHDVFLPLAERVGYAVPLSLWVLREACGQSARWQAEFGDRAPLVAIGLPGRHLRDHELIGHLRAILDDTGVQPGLVQLEIAQDVAGSPDGTQWEVLSLLQDMGFRVVIRGIGLGGLGLMSYAELPAHGIRLAGSWPTNAQEPDSLFTAAISTARSHGLTVYAADILDEDHVQLAKTLGVEIGQGEYIGPAGLPFEIEPLIEAGKTSLD